MGDEYLFALNALMEKYAHGSKDKELWDTLKRGLERMRELKEENDNLISVAVDQSMLIFKIKELVNDNKTLPTDFLPTEMKSEEPDYSTDIWPDVICPITIADWAEAEARETDEWVDFIDK